MLKTIHKKWMIGIGLRKIAQQMLLIFCILKKKKYYQRIFQTIIQPINSK